MVNVYKKLSWNEMADFDHDGRVMQGFVLPHACRYEVADCRARASEHFQKWLNNDR